MSKILKLLFLLLPVVFGIWGFDKYSYSQNLEKIVSEDTSDVLFRVESGETAEQIARNLQTENLVVSADSFSRYVIAEDMDDKLRAGRYILRRNMMIPEMAEKLTSDESEQLRVRLPEGFTVAQMDSYLADRSIIEAGELVRCASECDFSEFAFVREEPDFVKQKLEGYLFPDTYFHDARAVTAEVIIRRSLVEMARNLEQLDYDRTTNELLTIASLVEKETWTAEEKPVVAGILWGRLADGMRLDVDATTRYAVSKPKESLTQTDLNSDDPYNTRKVRGMPPGPIGSSSWLSLQAAADPADTEYRYYLHDAEGMVHYARTLEGHNANIQEWLR